MKLAILAGVMIAQVLAVDLVLAADSNSASPPWNVNASGERACKDCPGGKTFSFDAARGDEKPSAFNVANEMSRVLTVRTYDDKAAILGEVGSSAQIVTVYDLKSHKEIDKVYGYGFTFSHDGRYIAFKRFYPRHSPDEYVSDVVMLYDLASSPADNRVQDKNDKSPEDIGVPIFPRENAEKKVVRVFTDSDHFQVSGLAWSDSDKTLGFAAEKARLSEMQEKGYRAKEYLVVTVNLSQGLGARRVFVSHVPASDLTQSGSVGARAAPRVKDLSVTDDGKVELHTQGPGKLKPVVTVDVSSKHEEQY